MRRPASRVKRGHSFGLHKHDRCGCFDLRRNCCFVCRYNGTDRAGLDPKAQLARKPERPALHRCQCGAARECWNCNRSRVANRNGAWLFQIVHMKLAVSAKVLPESSEYFRSSKSMSGPGLSGVCIQARHSATPGGPPGARWSMLHSPSGADRTERHELHRSGNQRSCSQRRLRVPLVLSLRPRTSPRVTIICGS